MARGERNLTVTSEVEQDCRPGYWCTAGVEVSCEVGFYNPYPKSNNQSACLKCPERSSTRSSASTDLSQCVCEPDFYDELPDADAVHCVTCPSGTNCSQWGATVSGLPVRRGFYRQSSLSSNVWPCPADYKSGCRGTIEDADSKCFEGLEGVFCMLCTNSSRYYQKATKEMDHATCAACGDFDSLSDPFNVLAFLVVVAFALKVARRIISIGVVQTFVWWAARVKVGCTLKIRTSDPRLLPSPHRCASCLLLSS